MPTAARLSLESDTTGRRNGRAFTSLLCDRSLSAFSPDAVANLFIDSAKRSNIALSPMKLQKPLYYAHGWHLALTRSGSPLVSEQPQAWEHGSVFPSIYHEFKDFAGRPIIREAVEARIHDGHIMVYDPDMREEADADSSLDFPFATAVVNRIGTYMGAIVRSRCLR
jgi:uncharacterized phage-associated protein